MTVIRKKLMAISIHLVHPSLWLVAVIYVNWCYLAALSFYSSLLLDANGRVPPGLNKLYIILDHFHMIQPILY